MPGYLSDLTFHKAPIIVCGMPRSGTTFIGQLLKSHPRIAIADEFPLPVLLSVPKLLSEVEGLLTAPFESWRLLDPTSIPLRKSQLMLQLWAAVTGDTDQATRLLQPDIRPGVKTPSAELYHRFYEEIFAPAPPIWIYCVRHPVRVLQSFNSMPWASGNVVEQASDLYRRSFEAYRALKSSAPLRIFPVAIDQVGIPISDRLRWVSDILAFAKEAPTSEVERFVAEWPVVDYWSAQHGRRRADASVDTQSLLWFTTQPHVQEFCRDFGYDPGSR